MRRPDFSPTWSDFITDWCLGIPPSVSEEQTWLALDTLEHLWPEYLDELIQRGDRGILAISPVVHTGLALAACEPLDGFAQVLKRLTGGERSAMAEVTFAAALVKSGYRPSLEPQLNGKRLDAVVDAEGEQVYVEVIAPERSNAIMEGQTAINLLADTLLTNVGTNIEILFQTDISLEVSQRVLQFVESAPVTEEIQTIAGVAALLKRELKAEDVPVVGSTIPRTDSGPAIAISRIRRNETGVTAITVRLPVTDERAQRLLAGELHHFSQDEVNLLVINVTNVPRGIETWSPLLQRCLQPTRNRRVGAIILYEQSLSAHDGNIYQRWEVLRNPHAYKRIPESLLERIEILNEK
jgi:hypothetical protein